MDTTPERALLDQLLLRHQVEQFYNHEAELLDTRQFAAWLDLLTEDVRYWMPVTINKEYGKWEDERTREGKDLNWFDEGKFELEQRVRQIETRALLKLRQPQRRSKVRDYIHELDS